MSRIALSLQVGVVILAACLCNFSHSEDRTLSRQKRGFRLNSASRVAHGYGKRNYLDTDSQRYPHLGHALQPDSPSSLEADYGEDWSIMTVSEMVNQIQSHPKLARALLKKFVDTDDDDVIRADELFSPVVRK